MGGTRSRFCALGDDGFAGVRSAAIPILQAYGADRAFLFGSIAAGRAGPYSDVGVLVLGADPTLYWDRRRDLEQALGRFSDLFTQDDDPVFVAKIMARGQSIYERES